LLATLGLQVRHVDFFKRQLRVEQQVQQTKGGGTRGPPKTKESERVIPLPDVVLLKVFPGGPDDFLFRDPKGGPVVATRLMDSAWRPARNAAGLPEVTMHQLQTLGGPTMPSDR
jgi:integrase